MSVRGEWVELGDGLRGYYARPEGAGQFPSVVIYIEAFGLNEHFKRLTERFADAGFATITPDLYDGAVYAYDDLPNALAHLKRMDDNTVLARTEKALDFLAAREEADWTSVAVIGFCMGGRYAFLANAALASRFKAAAAFYGGGIGPVEDAFGRKTLLDRVGDMQAPIQLWYGTEDPFIRPDEHGRIAEALSRAGKQYTLSVFPGATHGFFCEDRESYDKDAARKSWRATTAFFHEYLGA
ncbi:dienelactone hydrolase family protein [Archangium violaceum]|uniref:dienelactone hydrolase family protein n=1 Tax=Archangium violaceum TaxID=83451 RepID=UPI002B28A317|nr:dienelactone hydrolase family protein [Archangium violaceum]